MNDVTEKQINKALKDFGKHVKAQAARRPGEVIQKLRAEIERLRPHADRLLYGKIEKPDDK